MDYTELKAEMKRHGYLTVLWHRDDIIGIAEREGHECTDEDADNIAKEIERTWDASIGINWDVIVENVRNYFEKL